MEVPHSGRFGGGRLDDTGTPVVRPKFYRPLPSLANPFAQPDKGGGKRIEGRGEQKASGSDRHLPSTRFPTRTGRCLGREPDLSIRAPPATTAAMPASQSLSASVAPPAGASSREGTRPPAVAAPPAAPAPSAPLAPPAPA